MSRVFGVWEGGRIGGGRGWGRGGKRDEGKALFFVCLDDGLEFGERHAERGEALPRELSFLLALNRRWMH